MFIVYHKIIIDICFINDNVMKTSSIIKGIHVVSWVVFIGLCIKAGAIIFCFVASLFKPSFAEDLYRGLDLSVVYAQDRSKYISLMSFVILISALKAYLFYLVVQIFLKLHVVRPFSEVVVSLISKISYYAIVGGGLGVLANRFTKYLVKRDVYVNTVGDFWVDSEAFLFMGAIVFVIAQVFSQGVSLQTENDLTV